ncbi:hypothetical protein BT96DRAFT_393908 [Gymnopus androsaceus JB14]|uniref:Uncharacterized protein n=1 Tax=Gymnopus androsaceus JB14 TaxID=1447944 RepID=A0A6A4GVX0_9AGAR|nr:hypothetical protein BT96DRAFT_393908 [Gymnopus androsaceus JB14]
MLRCESAMCSRCSFDFVGWYGLFTVCWSISCFESLQTSSPCIGWLAMKISSHSTRHIQQCHLFHPPSHSISTFFVCVCVCVCSMIGRTTISQIGSNVRSFHS